MKEQAVDEIHTIYDIVADEWTNLGAARSNQNKQIELMAFYSAKQATLGEIEGNGYAFQKRTVFGKEYEGVFFTNQENLDQLESLAAKDSVVFTGTVYIKNRSGDVRKKQETFEVDIHNLVSVGIGERADFRVIEE